ncbi:MAG: hypothetical protein Q9182_005168 [Xanthomendoza sp. 2 TL-2023]
MPFIPHTPESLLPRSDSKSAATTCKGITSSGRPCRRELKIQNPKDGILAVVSINDAEAAAAFFCWQHKDQAAGLASPSPATGAAALYPLNRRTSTDTLMERLGFLSLDDELPGQEIKKPNRRPANKEKLPPKWQEVPGPLLAVSTSERPYHRPKPRHRRPHPLLALLCCGGYEDEDPLPAPRKERSSLAPETRQSTAPPRSHTREPTQSSHTTRRRHSSGRPMVATKSTNRPSMPHDPPSQTTSLLAMIPKALSPQTTSNLLSELAKPVSPHDEEGYIYIFRLTPSSTTGQSSPRDPSVLLTPSRGIDSRASPSTLQKHRASSSELNPIAAKEPKNNQTVLLKIGRASNVQRRMNEWTRQCGYDLTLLRFYPYIASSPVPSPIPSPSSRTKTSSLPSTPTGSAPRKVPHAHKVERLIHLELADKRVKKECEACGKEHREWFEVNGDREGVRGIDEVCRRWVGWGEGI